MSIFNLIEDTYFSLAFWDELNRETSLVLFGKTIKIDQKMILEIIELRKVKNYQYFYFVQMAPTREGGTRGTRST